MKKKIVLLIALLMVVCMAIGCSEKENIKVIENDSSVVSDSAQDSSAEVAENDSALTIIETSESVTETSESVTETEMKSDNEGTMAVDFSDVEDLFMGHYVNNSFFNELVEEKSVVDIEADQLFINIYNSANNGAVCLMQCTAHQGNAECKLIDVVYDESENKYILNFEPYKEGCPTVMEYYVTEDRYVYTGAGTGITLSDDVKFFGENDEVVGEYMAYILLKDSPDVKVKDERIYIDIDGTEKWLSIMADTIFDGLYETKLRDTNPCGYVCLNDKDINGELMYYYIEDGKFVVKSSEAEVLATLAFN